ncbi:MAG: sugar phosphate nucleotidyltransferase, partial [Candidatus Aegiribacteria sp.]
MSRIIAVVLGGGRGTRLFPLTRDRSKPAVPIGGKYRIIDIPLSNCINDGIRHILVLTQYNSESLNRHVARTYRFDRFTHGFVSILAAEQTNDNSQWFQGTADAVRQSLKYISGQHPDLVLILSGDQLYRMDFNRFGSYHLSSGADITIGTIPVTDSEASSLGIMKVGDDGIITEFREKPSGDALESMKSAQKGTTDAKPYLGNMGIYMFSPKILSEVLEREPDVIDFGREIIPNSIDSYRVTSFPFGGYWSDIGTISNFFRANLDMAGPK